MFERFTERARKAVVFAQEEARRFGHAYIGTEYLLLGLLREEEGIAARALESLDVSLDAARGQLESIVGYGEDRDFAQAPFTPRSKKVFELGLRESMRLGHNYIGTEHILLGLARESEGVASQMLSNLGVDPDAVRREVMLRLGYAPEPGPLDVADAKTQRNRSAFRTRITGLEVRVRCGRSTEERAEPQLFVLDLEIVHGAPAAIDLEESVEKLAHAIEPVEFTLFESLVDRAGEHALEALPMADEVTVVVTRDPKPADRLGPGLSAQRTFRR